MKDIAVYTVILDKYDPLRVPPERRLLDEADFYCFTNSQLISDYYTIVPTEKMFDSASLTNRYYKILSHPKLSKYKYTIYHDGSVQITAHTLQPLITQILKGNHLALFKHRFRTCIYEEAKAVVYYRRANYRVVYNHVRRYRQEGYPASFGLIEGGVIVRNNQLPQLKNYMNAWWQEVYNNAPRDQLSFNYIVWKYPINVAFIPGDMSHNDFFKYCFHPAKLPPKTLLEKFVCRYWAIRIDLLQGKFSFGNYLI